MSITASPITLTTCSDAEQVSFLCEALHALCLYASGNETGALGMQLAVAEALNNIVIHAYHNQPGHEIVVQWSVTDRKVRIDIMDDGSSIQFLPEPQLPDFEAENSRGWWIINAGVDEYFYQTIESVENTRTLRVGNAIVENAGTVKTHTNILTLLKQF